MKGTIVSRAVVAALVLTGCGARGGYGGFVNAQLGQVQNHQFGSPAGDLTGASNRELTAAEYRSDVQADTVENHARAQHAELGVIDHRLDTARRGQYYDHRAHMEGNLENRDDFGTIESITDSISDTGRNIENALDNFSAIFK